MVLSAAWKDYSITSFFIIPVAFPALYILFILYLSPLSGIPGPFSASFSKWWLIRHALQGDPHREILRIHKRYGKIVRVGPNEVSVNDAAAFRTIYGAGSKFRKGDFYGVWQGSRKFDLFAERSQKIHASHRKLVSGIYSLNSLKSMEPYVDETISVLLGKMRGILGQSLDMGLWFQLFAFDVIGEVTFSKPFGFLDKGKDDGAFGEIEEVALSGSWIGQIPSLYWLHDFLEPMIGNHIALNNRHGKIREFAIREINARKDRGSHRPDILAKLFEMQKMKPEEMNDQAVISMVSTNIFAGSDTTAASLRAIIYYLLKTPECMQKLIDEIEDLKQKDSVSSIVTLKQAQEMPYLQACIHESMRMFPVSGLALPRVVPPGGIHIDSHFIPEGMTVGVNAWALHYNYEIFGNDAEVFRPDRWLQQDTGDMERCFFSWGRGSRTCIGKNLAMMEISKLIPTLFMHFDMKLTNPNEEWTERCIWFMKQEGLNVTIFPREMLDDKQLQGN
ncbi:hypothetical protein OIDMADRAFT_46617 [Oidiodendron maius Zn]|uniref:Cytochrome P450 n=1 Tax=Oidiodendron maius (strain Zn) TaxID=913774 RepID=A0A0C3GQ45_OIDMZ|nr:hypothetical protein OIDMADRAFT_46617 [Oidiodendron maius Zn]